MIAISKDLNSWLPQMDVPNKILIIINIIKEANGIIGLRWKYSASDSRTWKTIKYQRSDNEDDDDNKDGEDLELAKPDMQQKILGVH